MLCDHDETVSTGGGHNYKLADDSILLDSMRKSDNGLTFSGRCKTSKQTTLFK